MLPDSPVRNAMETGAPAPSPTGQFPPCRPVASSIDGCPQGELADKLPR